MSSGFFALLWGALTTFLIYAGFHWALALALGLAAIAAGEMLLKIAVFLIIRR